MNEKMIGPILAVLSMIIMITILVTCDRSKSFEMMKKSCAKTCYPLQVIMCENNHVGCADNTVRKLKY